MSDPAPPRRFRGRRLFLVGLLVLVGLGAVLWEARDRFPTCSLPDRLAGASGCAAVYVVPGLTPLPVATMAAPPAGGLAIVGSERVDGAPRAVLVRFDPWAGREIARLPLPMDPGPASMRASPDGSEIALFCPSGAPCVDGGSSGLVVRAADAAPLTWLEAGDAGGFRFEGGPAEDEAGFAAVAVPGTTLVAEADAETGTVIVRDTGEGGAVVRLLPAHRFPLDAETFALSPSPGGRFLAATYAAPPETLGTGSLILVWDVASHRIVTEIDTGPEHRIEPKLAWSRDERSLFAARRVSEEDGTGLVVERFVLPERD